MHKVGSTFSAVTHSGRIIPLAKVIMRSKLDSPYTYKVRWYDENGKHYEWFNLDDTSIEFREFNFITGGDNAAKGD